MSSTKVRKWIHSSYFCMFAQIWFFYYCKFNKKEKPPYWVAGDMMHEIVIDYLTLAVAIVSLFCSYFAPYRVAKLNSETQMNLQKNALKNEAEKEKKTDKQKNIDEFKKCVLNYQTHVDKIIKAGEYDLSKLEDTFNEVKNTLELILPNNKPKDWDSLNQEIEYIFTPEPNTSPKYYQSQAKPLYESVKKDFEHYIKEQCTEQDL